MAKQCSFCEFASDDAAAFGEHMREVHQWDRLALARPASSGRRGLITGFGGAIVAVAALCFLLWSGEQICYRDSPGSYCGDVWFGLLAVPVIGAAGFGIGIVVGERLTEPAKPKAETTDYDADASKKPTGTN